MCDSSTPSPSRMPRFDLKKSTTFLTDTVHIIFTSFLQNTDCKQGMIGFVNQPNASAIDAYQTGASTLDINVSPDSDAFGGILATNPNATAVGTGGSSATTASATGESGGDGASASSTAATATSGTASASASGTGNNDTSGAEARAVGAGGVLALMMALMAA